MHFDTLILGGRLIDGTGGPSRFADVGIIGGRIARVGKLGHATAGEVIDAAGKVVAPGHITQHAHYDAALFWSPYCLDSGEHGVTSVLNANCGFSIAPVRATDRERIMAMLATTEQVPVEQQRIAIPWTWETFPEFMECLRNTPKGVNVMTYLPVNPLLVYVMGVEAAKNRRPTPSEMAEMHRIINEAMDLGAMGISLSVMGAEGNSHVDFDGTVMPTDAMHDDDVVELARAVAARGEGLIQVLAQIGGNGNKLLTEKISRMAKGSGARVIHNIFLAVDGMPEMVEADLAWLDSLLAEGLDVVGATLLHCGWVEAGIRDLDTAAGQMQAIRDIIACQCEGEVRALLADQGFIQRFVSEYAANGPSNGAGGFEAQTIIEIGPKPELQRFLGRTLSDIGAETRQTVVEVLCDLALKSDLALQIKSAPYSAVDGSLGARLLSHPFVTAGVSDGGAHTKAFSSGSYATEMLIRMVREQKVMTLEAMHHQLSFKIARALNLPDRGALLPGYWADILIYDLDALTFDRSRHQIVHDMPGGDWRRLVKAGGYDRILVNGVSTFEKGRCLGGTPGLLICSNDNAAPAVAAE